MNEMNSIDRALARSMVTVAMFTGLAALARVAQEVAIAWRFGISGTVDAYAFLMSLVNWPVSVWSGLLTVLLVPAFAQLRLQPDARFSRFRAELLGASLVVATVGGALFWVGTHAVLAGPMNKLSLSVVDEARQMTNALSLAVPLGVLVSLLSVWMLAFGRHSNTLIEAIPPLAVVGALILLPGMLVEALLWGTLGGIGVRLMLLWMLHLGPLGIDRPRFSFSEPAWTNLWRAGAVLIVGQALTSVTVIVDQFFAARLGEGAIATFNYANRIVGVFALLGATVIQRATLPIFSSAYAADDPAAPRTALRWAIFAFLAGAIILALVVLVAPSLTRLAFERGAFSSRDTYAVSMLVKYYVIHLPFYFASLVLVSALAARSLYRVIAVVAGANLVVKVSANFILTPFLGLAGIALSSSAMYGISLLLCYAAIARSREMRGHSR